MPVLPEEEAGDSGEVSIALLPFQEKGLRESWLARWHLRQPVLFGVGAACAFGFALLVLALLYLVDAESRLTEWATKAFANVAVVFLCMPIGALLCGVVVLVLFLRRGRRAIDAARSLFAVFVGFHAVLVLDSILPGYRLRGSDLLVQVTSFALLAAAGVVAGWVTAHL